MTPVTVHIPMENRQWKLKRGGMSLSSLANRNGGFDVLKQVCRVATQQEPVANLFDQDNTIVQKSVARDVPDVFVLLTKNHQKGMVENHEKRSIDIARGQRETCGNSRGWKVGRIFYRTGRHESDVRQYLQGKSQID